MVGKTSLWVVPAVLVLLESLLGVWVLLGRIPLVGVFVGRILLVGVLAEEIPLGEVLVEEIPLGEDLEEIHLVGKVFGCLETEVESEILVEIPVGRFGSSVGV